jgi:hypothetical protein
MLMPCKDHSRAFSFILIPALTYLVLLAVITRADFIDDAFIGFRYLHHLLAGQGFTYNPPERVEGVTNIGWLLALAPLAELCSETCAAKIMGSLFTGLSVVITLVLARGLAPEHHGSRFVLPLPILVATHPDFTLFSLLGMETAFLGTLLLAGAWMVMTGRSLIITASIAVLAFLVRPEAGLIFPLFLLLRAGDRQGRKKVLGPAAVFLAGVGLITLARVLYFGDLLPHTAQVKTAGMKEILISVFLGLRGRNANLPFPFNNLFSYALMALGTAAAWQRSRETAAWLTASVLAGMLFCLYAPADWTGMGRYFAPYTPAGAFLLWTGVVTVLDQTLASRLPGLVLRSLPLLLALLLAGGNLGQTFLHLRPAFARRYPGYVIFGAGLVAPSQWLHDNLPPDAVVATRRIGAAGYYSGLRIFDYKFGLVDRQVARTRAAADEDLGYPTHPVLAELWRERAPDYLLEDAPIIEAMMKENGGPGRISVHGIYYRELKRFPLGERVDWVLCEKLPAEFSESGP